MKTRIVLSSSNGDLNTFYRLKGPNTCMYLLILNFILLYSYVYAVLDIRTSRYLLILIMLGIVVANEQFDRLCLIMLKHFILYSVYYETAQLDLLTLNSAPN